MNAMRPVFQALLFTLSVTTLTAAPLGAAFTYQGCLDEGSNPVNGIFELKFSLYDNSAGGVRVADPQTNTQVVVRNGLFTTTLDVGASAFAGAQLWLELEVRTNGGGAFTPLSPRQRLTAAPYAVWAAAADSICGLVPGTGLAGTYGNAVNLNNPANMFSGNGGALTNVNAAALGGLGASGFWQLGGNLGTAAGVNSLGTLDNQPLEIKVNDVRVLRLEPKASGSPNIIGGAASNTVGAGVSGSTIGGGGAPTLMESNAIASDFSTIAGGSGNIVYSNAPFAAIGGGRMNQVFQNRYRLGSGNRNSVIGGGSFNAVWVANSTISGGLQNRIGASGSQDRDDSGGTIGGGVRNLINYENAYSTIGGGVDNLVDGSYANIAGGNGNAIRWVGSSEGHSIGGGARNQIRSGLGFSTISGGYTNSISGGAYSVIGGGRSNLVSGSHSVIPGGFNNEATDYAFAAGRRAKAIHTGAFVWGDSTDADVSSTAPDQFVIRASGGVGIGTPSPTAALHVAGDTRLEGLVCAGSQTGTAESPDKPLLVRRVKTTTISAGSIVARTDKLTLERDGSRGGWRIVNAASPGNTTIAARGLTPSGGTVNFVTFISSGAVAGTTVVFTDAQNVVSFRCSFGDNFGPGHQTEVSLSRYLGDLYWAGTLTSTFNQ
jgi:hypothetical protein